ncbi:MAG: EAL domain-containing protein [Alphaproteobacteria bacterium]
MAETENNSDRLLAVDDEQDICDLVADVSYGMGFVAATLSDPTMLSAKMRSFDPTVIVLDLQMPSADGVTLLRQLSDMKCQAAILLLSGVDARTLATAERLGKEQGLRMLGRLQKPVDVSALEALLGTARKVDAGVSADDLRRAIAVNEFFVAYQPKMCLKEGRERITGVEALVRWQHPRLGTIPPMEFIPLAERTGLIAPLTDLVLRDVARQMRIWAAAGVPLNVAVNVSSILLDDLGLPDRIAALLDAQGVDRTKLTVEVTETAAMANACKSMDVLARFRLKGFDLSIDDFGTGYSSLVQLFRLPFSEIKIDKSFTLEIETSEEARVIARSIADLARNLNLKVCAEGVETPEALAYLRELRVDTVQGYLIGKPMRAVDLETALRRMETSDDGSAAAVG